MHRIHSWIVCGLVPLVLLAGCSQSGHELAPVHGRVTLDGQPVVSAMVMFQPEGKGSPSYGSTDQEGRYQLGFNRTQQGAMIGWHTARIQEGTVAAGADGKKIKGVPPHYNKSGELRREVKPGNNEINFELTTVEK